MYLEQVPLIDLLLISLKFVFAVPFFLFILFEIIPLFFGVKSTILKNFPDLLRYQIYRAFIVRLIGIVILISILLLPFGKYWFDLREFSLFSQIIILYFFIEFFVYLGHMSAHKYKAPFLTKAHSFHHETKEDLQWVNSAKEHYFVKSLFLIIFCFIYYVVFHSSNEARVIVTAAYLTLNAFSHYHIPFSIPLLNQIFLFPKEHRRHHTDYSGPYGVTLSLFDTLFNTRDDYKK